MSGTPVFRRPLLARRRRGHSRKLHRRCRGPERVICAVHRQGTTSPDASASIRRRLVVRALPLAGPDLAVDAADNGLRDLVLQSESAGCRPRCWRCAPQARPAWDRSTSEDGREARRACLLCPGPPNESSRPHQRQRWLPVCGSCARPWLKLTHFTKGRIAVARCADEGPDICLWLESLVAGPSGPCPDRTRNRPLGWRRGAASPTSSDRPVERKRAPVPRDGLR